MRLGGIVLCGGKSRRMGLDKATLPFGGEVMLNRVLRLLSEVAEPLVVVAAQGQPLPDLPAGTLVAVDERLDAGPLEGLHAGLSAIGEHVQAAYATSCDVPLLVPDFVRRLAEFVPEYQAVVPIEEKFHHPLAAVYSVEVLPIVRRLLEADRRRPIFVYDEVRTKRIPVEQLRGVDPELQTLANLNSPADYQNALAAAGFAIDPEVARRLER